MEIPFVKIDKLLTEGQKVVLARIIQQEGSTPRSTGTGCLILEDGSILGTIGGGRLEYEVGEKAKDVFLKGKSAQLHFELTGADVSQTEMLCGGVVDAYLEPLSPENETAGGIFRKISEIRQKGDRGIFITVVGEGIDATHSMNRLFISGSGEKFGSIDLLSPEELEQIENDLSETRGPTLLVLEKKGTAVFIEPVVPDDVLYIFGAGHISTFVAHFAKIVGFRVVVIDDREEFANRDRFPGADEIFVGPFERAFEQISLTDSAYIAIVTRGHLHDRVVLKAALGQNATYIGMIGSRRKRNLVYRSLIEEGFPEEKLEGVCCPIGLDIGGETPEEIAISIVAELIHVRNS